MDTTALNSKGPHGVGGTQIRRGSVQTIARCAAGGMGREISLAIAPLPWKTI